MLQICAVAPATVGGGGGGWVMLKFRTHTWWVDGKSFHEVNKYMILISCVIFVFFR